MHLVDTAVYRFDSESPLIRALNIAFKGHQRNSFTF